MSGTNGNGPERRDAMLVATRGFVADLDGERIEIAEGERVAPEHELVARFPDCFGPAPGGSPIAERGVVDRSRDDPGALERELRIRRERIQQINSRARQRPGPPTGQEIFWRNVDELLGTAQQERDDKAAVEMYDEIDAARAESMAADREDIAGWLDRE